MNWTKEIPTVDGWYWFRSEWDTWVEEVREGNTFSFELEAWQSLPKAGLEFYGPLEEPK